MKNLALPLLVAAALACLAGCMGEDTRLDRDPAPGVFHIQY